MTFLLLYWHGKLNFLCSPSLEGFASTNRSKIVFTPFYLCNYNFS